MTPGPVPVPERVLQAMAEPVIHHRAPDFIPVFQKVRADLKRVFQTEQDVIVLVGTGTAGMEASVANLLGPGDKAVVVRGGKFGEPHNALENRIETGGAGFEHIGELYESNWHTPELTDRAVVIVEQITESIHQSFDGWTDAEKMPLLLEGNWSSPPLRIKSRRSSGRFRPSSATCGRCSGSSTGREYARLAVSLRTSTAHSGAGASSVFIPSR